MTHFRRIIYIYHRKSLAQTLPFLISQIRISFHINKCQLPFRPADEICVILNGGKSYCPKHQPLCVPHQFLLGARQSRRAIARYLSGRGEHIVPTSATGPRPERIHCAYPSRSSQTSAAQPCAARPHRAPASPAITTAPP